MPEPPRTPAPPTPIGVDLDRWGRIRRTWRIYRALLGAAVRSGLAYRADFVLGVLGGIALQGTGMAFIGIILTTFGSIGGWGIGEVAFLYGLRLTVHGVFTVPGAQVFSIDRAIRLGEFDRYLVRPISPLVQLLTHRVAFTVVGDLLGGVALLVVASTLVDVAWTPAAIGFLVLAILGGAGIEFACHLTISAMAFRLLSVRSFRLMVDNAISEFGNYPMVIFPTLLRFGLTFVLPIAFAAYLPATVLLDRTDELSISPWFAYLAPLVGFALVYAAHRFWKHQIRHYHSSGH